VNPVLRVSGFAAAAVLLLGTLGCPSTTTVGTASSDAGFASAPPVAAPTDSGSLELPPPLPKNLNAPPVTEPLPGGSVDWTAKVVRAKGTGVLDPGNPNKAQARLLAERAAVVVAQRNLLEIVKGVRVDSDTKVENFMTRYDVVYSHVDGIVKGARQLGPATFDSLAGTVEVEIEVPLYGSGGVDEAVAPALPAPGAQSDVSASSLSPQVREFLRQFGGLALDAGSTGLRPSLYPKIYDDKGNLLLDTKDYLRHTGQYGSYAVQFVGALDQILGRPEFARQPLLLKVKQVTGRLGSDIILGSADADKLKWLKDGARFLFNAGRFLVKLML
jgi:hypothetical protein